MAAVTDPELACRSTREVLDDHLRLRRDGDLETDLARNYAADVQVLSLVSTGHGHDALRSMADDLESTCPDADFSYDEVLVDGRIGMLVWSATCPGGRIRDAVDSFVVENGRIVVQTAHYHLRDVRDPG